MQVPKRRSEQFRKYQPTSGPVYLTPAGKTKLEKRLQRLKKEIPDLIAEVQRTKEYGDLSENAEYQAAKAKLRQANNRILAVKTKLARTVLINQSTKSSGLIELGSKVTVEFERKLITYQILGSEESNPSHGKISYLSPLASALMGHTIGDTVYLSTPKREFKYRIIKVD